MRYVICLFLVVFSSSCSRSVEEDSLLVRQRVRKMQTRTFPNQSVNIIYKEVIGILQDEGYMVKNVSGKLGLITAELSTDIEKFSSKFWAILFSGRRARWKKHSTIEITANITEAEEGAQIRINYLVRIFDNLGRTCDVHQVLEDDIYMEFFNRLEMGIFSI